jgi:hypothetical protein
MKRTWDNLEGDEKTLENLFKGPNSEKLRNTYMKYFTGSGENRNRDKMAAYDISKSNDSDDESDDES